jgi:hypothetical protein
MFAQRHEIEYEVNQYYNAWYSSNAVQPLCYESAAESECSNIGVASTSCNYQGINGFCASNVASGYSVSEPPFALYSRNDPTMTKQNMEIEASECGRREDRKVCVDEEA